MVVKAACILAIAITLIVDVAPRIRAGEVETPPIGSGCNWLEGNLAIIELNNQPVRNYSDLRNELAKLHGDATMYLTVRQALPTVGSKVFKIAVGAGTVSQTGATAPTATENTPQSEGYYEMISGCVNCVIPGIELRGVRVQVLVSEDNSMTPPVKRGSFTVTAPPNSSAAGRAGVRYGDQIVEINGEPVSKMTLMEAIGQLQGATMGGDTLTMARTVGKDKEYTFTLPRR